MHPPKARSLRRTALAWPSNLGSIPAFFGFFPAQISRRLALTGRWPDDAQEDVGPDDSLWSANLMPINAQIEVLSYQFSNI
jgi:hypothetical protein